MEIRRFAFVIHPLTIKGIHDSPLFWWTRYLPSPLVEWAAAFMPPIYLSRITGIRSPTTGQRVEGFLYALSATPSQMLAHHPRFSYKRIIKTARLAEKQGAGIIGLGAFTSIVGDAGITIARESPIAVTSGNSLTAAAAVEAAKKGAQMMGIAPLGQCRVMVLGATGSIGSACARLLVEQARSVVLISRSNDKLSSLKQRINARNPTVEVIASTNATDHLAECDIIICATSAFGQRVLDVSHCKPGAVICDVARPHDISHEEAASRPDVFVIDSGEIKMPGDVDMGYDIGLAPGIAFACMAETALLTLEGRFESFTLGRDLDTNKINEILQLFTKHQFELAPLRSFGQPITDTEIAQKRAQADALRKELS